jgi:Endonuclease/Exonuclease/phosphatase family
MTVVQHLIGPAATLPSAPTPPPPLLLLPSVDGTSTTNTTIGMEQLSVLSYNILLPNSIDGWWTYKMYMPPLPPERQYQSSWEYRKQLLRNRIQQYNPDIICLQEVSPQSFTQDFEFLTQELGYDGVALFPKGRFRPATFWKTSTCHLVMEPGGAVAKDRTLLTAFRLTNTKGNNNNSNNGPPPPTTMTTKKNTTHKKTLAPPRNWYILNCHLQAGKNGPRRLRQIQEGIKAVRTLAKKQKGRFFGRVGDWHSFFF